MNDINEAVYPGNLGFVEYFDFLRAANPEQKTLMNQYIKQGDGTKVADLIHAVTGVRLRPFQRNESLNRDKIFKR